MPCPRLLALYAFLKQMGACRQAERILDPAYVIDHNDVWHALALLDVDLDERDVIMSLWNRVPDAQANEAALSVLEQFMWRYYSYRAEESFRQQIWCLYYEEPPCADRLPF